MAIRAVWLPEISKSPNEAIPGGSTSALGGHITSLIAADPLPEEVLGQVAQTISELDSADLKTPNTANTLDNKINAALVMIDEGRYEEAVDKLRNDILKKTDGCANIGGPDKNDWIVTCEGQQEVYSLIVQAIELLENLT